MFSEQSKLKVFADDKLKVFQLTQFVYDGVENIVGKGENAGNQHFLFFQQRFKSRLADGRGQ